MYLAICLIKFCIVRVVMSMHVVFEFIMLYSSAYWKGNMK